MLDNIACSRLIRDTNRLRKGTQREFHAACQERANAGTIITERAARELAPQDGRGANRGGRRLTTQAPLPSDA